MRALLCGLALALISVIGPASTSGQAPPQLEFDVASVRPTRLDVAEVKRAASAGTAVRIGKQIRGSRVEYIAMSIGQLICEAYDVSPFQVIGPDWLGNDRFDIIATRPEASSETDLPRMLQSLLTDRFRLKVHREEREQEVALLIAGKDGAKLKPTPPSSEASGEGERGLSARVEAGGRRADVNLAVTQNGASIRSTIKNADKADAVVHVEASGMTMAGLADFLTRRLARDGLLVVDGTGLAGQYNVTLDVPISQFGAAVRTGERPVGEQDGGPADAASAPLGHSLLSQSLRELGLDLVNRKHPVSKLIVDHVERTPTEN